ncbi:site-specific integrase [Nocardioides pocheonensis]|uniref:Site-specific integrase n=1 Tax=Nocardioides pocheonensis TaxID=661485 RepID=A0A3N0GIN5_9ACTN|nr:site-specific integrase [Nocardioides pocheonensis]RNM12066.1 site-specific integrase [Nocardioides pocheonensis]
MSGNVSRRPSGEWEYRFEAGPDRLTGKRRRVTKSGYRTKREATQAMNQAIAAFHQGRHVQRTRRTVEDFLNEWHSAVRSALRPSTWVNYRNYLDAYVIPVIGDTPLQDLDAVRLNLLYGHLLERGRVKSKGGLSPKTVQNVHRMLHRAMRDAVKWGQLPRNYAEDAEPPRAPRPRPTVWTPEQLGAFVQHVRNDRFYALWLLVATTGLRRGELAGLQRHDIDFRTRTISPSTPRVVVAGRAVESEAKTRSGVRNLALDPVTLEALRDYVVSWDTERDALGQDTQLLFVWPNGRPLHPDTITALFHQHCERAGLPRIRLHDVRHSYATAALKAGIPAKVISERLGHATAAFTLQTYTHVIPGMDELAAEAIARMILTPAVADADAGGSILGSITEDAAPETSKEPADLLRFRRSAGSSSSSGGRI